MTKSRGSNEIVIVFKINFYFLNFKSSSQGKGKSPSLFSSIISDKERGNYHVLRLLFVHVSALYIL